ncbi:MAG TPA: hypothetical protein VLC94_11445 [Candidatus Acidoferrum sp.]|nr:hypothetical protein [Candidatus Acidoferrum sp.]
MSATPIAATTNQQVSLSPALVPVICAALLYAISWLSGCSTSPASPHRPGGGK